MLTRCAIASAMMLLLASATQALPVTIDDHLNSAGAAESDTGGAHPANKQPASSQRAEDWTVAIYPVLAWAPILGASVSESPPSASHLPYYSGSVSGSLNGAAFFGLAFQKKWFVADLSALWASVGGSASQPPVSIDTSALFYDASAGVKLNRDLSLTAGVRHMGLKIDARVDDNPELNYKPSVTDPILGIEWRPSLSKSWGFDLALEGGGFGVGSDVDLSATGRFDWRFARHFGMTMGYGALHFQITSQFTDSTGTYTRVAKQTLHGPIFGFGIYF